MTRPAFSIDRGLRQEQGQLRLKEASSAFQRGDFKTAADAALAAVDLDETRGAAWYVLGAVLSKTGQLELALAAYESALRLMPERIEIASELGQLAFRLNRIDQAVGYFADYYQACPHDIGAANNLANALREQHQFDAAIAVLRQAISHDPSSPMLWNSLGAVLEARADPAAAIPFFEESLRLDPSQAKTRCNLAVAKIAVGDTPGALLDCEAALTLTDDRAELARIRMARSSILLKLGRIGEAWDDYEARLDPHYAGVTHFLIDRPRWNLEDSLEGQSLLLFGEQGLGDQVLFAGTVPDLLDRLGPSGRLTIAVENRLMALFERAFPQAAVIGLQKSSANGRNVRMLPGFDPSAIDLWTPMASLLGRLRRSLADYPAHNRFLSADPERVEHWKRLTRGLPGRKVGLLWKSLTLDGARSKHFAPFEQWRPILETPGMTFVNLQYGECAEELDYARQALGVDIWTPPGIDLRNDLDDVAALCAALDLTIGFSNASFNLAGAVGAPAWLIAPEHAWTMLGTDRYPWYPQVSCFTSPDGWAPALEAAAAALTAL